MLGRAPKKMFFQIFFFIILNYIKFGSKKIRVQSKPHKKVLMRPTLLFSIYMYNKVFFRNHWFWSCATYWNTCSPNRITEWIDICSKMLTKHSWWFWWRPFGFIYFFHNFRVIYAGRCRWNSKSLFLILRHALRHV